MIAWRAAATMRSSPRSTTWRAPESTQVQFDGKAHDVLLLAMPLLAWSRYKLPATTLSSSVLDNLRTQLSGHLVARPARVAVADYLFAIDQLPEAFSDVRRLTEQLGDAAAESIVLHVDPKNPPGFYRDESALDEFYEHLIGTGERRGRVAQARH